MSTAVVAIGGNSLIADPKHQSVPDQFAATRARRRPISRTWCAMVGTIAWAICCMTRYDAQPVGAPDGVKPLLKAWLELS